ncbi:MAG: tetratricopeptide repeat protein [Brochothrix thermosphacta]|uniref:tetratricopeptide repeat protein n=1 Tax=Brochothrix thermosphacta TaxID=2756 RepID=UPI003F8EED49
MKSLFSFLKNLNVQSKSDASINKIDSTEKLLALYRQKNYKRIPFLPNNEECSKILDRYDILPSLLVRKEYMDIIYQDDLYRGDIIYLWWLANPRTNKKKIPAYFVFKYGISVNERSGTLISLGYIDKQNNLTDKAVKLIELHSSIINEHKFPEPLLINDKQTEIYVNDKAFYDDLLNRGVINEQEYKEAFETTKAANDASDELLTMNKYSSKELKMVNNNKRGITLEKSGDVDKAIELYEYNIKHRFQGNHPYDRLAIIYRKQKRINDEIRVLEVAVDVFEKDVYKKRPDRNVKTNRFKERLGKVHSDKKHENERRNNNE